MNFIFQKEFRKKMDEYGERIEEICARHGITFIPITIKPFEHTVEDDMMILSNINEPTVVYGSNVALDVVNNYELAPGWFHVDHSEENAMRVFGTDYINFDMLVCSTSDYAEKIDASSLAKEEFFFMKPNDEKYFPGTIVDRQMMPFVIESQGRNHGTPDVYDLCISPVKHIVSEWRFFVVGGRLVDGSKYHGENLVLDIQAGYPNRIEWFVLSMIDKFDGEGTYVIDIAEMKNGDLKVVEINCLNCSGFYENNLEKIVLAIKSLVDN